MNGVFLNRRLAILLLCAFAVVPYLGTLAYDFTLDDFGWIVKNPEIHSLKNVPRMFTTALFEGRHYRPLARASFALDYAVAGLHPWIYHAVNIALHALVTVLVYFVLRRFGERVAWIAAALFAVIPVHTEVVANATSRSEILAALFGLLALTQLKRPPLAALFVFLAMCGKEGAVAVPALALVLWWRDYTGNNQSANRRPSIARMAVVLAWLCAGIVAFVALNHVARGRLMFPSITIIELDNPLVLAPIPDALRTALLILAQNFVICLVPYHLAADYGAFTIPLVTSWFEPRFLAWIAVLVATGVLAWRLRTRFRGLPAGYAWFLLAALPTANLLFFINTIRGDRLIYLASAGPCLMAAEAIAALWHWRRNAGIVLLAGLILCFGVLTVRRNRIWRNPETLAEASVKDTPANVHVRCWYGERLMGRGEYAAAVAQYREALRAFPDIPLAQFQLAACLTKTGNEREAETLFRHLSVADPGSMLFAELLTQQCSRRGDWACVASTVERVLAHNAEEARKPSNWAALRFAWQRANRPERAAEAANREAALR